MERRITGAFEKIPLRQRPARGVRPAWVAAGLGVAVIAALVVGQALLQWRGDLRPAALSGYAAGICFPTPTTRWQTTPLFGGSYLVTTNGDLAGQPRDRLFPGDAWYIRNEPRQAAIRLVAERLDEPADRIEFEAIGYPLGATLQAEWAVDWYYRTSVEALEILPTKGCWRVSLAGQPERGQLVYELKPRPGSPGGTTNRAPYQ